MAAFHATDTLASHFPGFRADRTLIRLAPHSQALSEQERDDVMSTIGRSVPEMMRTDWTRSKVVHDYQSDGYRVKTVRLYFGDGARGRWVDRAFVFSDFSGDPQFLSDVIDPVEGCSLADLAAAYGLVRVSRRPVLPGPLAAQANILSDYFAARTPLSPSIREPRQKLSTITDPSLRVIADRLRIRDNLADDRWVTLARLKETYPLDPYLERAALLDSAFDPNPARCASRYQEFVRRFGPPPAGGERLVRSLTKHSADTGVRYVRDALEARPEEVALLDELRRALPDSSKQMWAMEVEHFRKGGHEWPRYQQTAAVRAGGPETLRALEWAASQMRAADRKRLDKRLLAASRRWADLKTALRDEPPTFKEPGDAELVGDMFLADELQAHLDLFPIREWPAVTMAALEVIESEFDADDVPKMAKQWQRLATLAEKVQKFSGEGGKDARVRYCEGRARLGTNQFAKAAELLKPLQGEKLLEDYGVTEDYRLAMVRNGKAVEAYRESGVKEEAFDEFVRPHSVGRYRGPDRPHRRPDEGCRRPGKDVFGRLPGLRERRLRRGDQDPPADFGVEKTGAGTGRATIPHLDDGPRLVRRVREVGAVRRIH